MLRFWAKHWALIVFLHVGTLPLLDAGIVKAVHSKDEGLRIFCIGTMYLVIGSSIATILIAVAHHFKNGYLRNRLAANRCTACGYDLRVTPNRCPECGRTVDQETIDS